MKLKNLLCTLGLAAVLGIGVGAGLAAKQDVKETKATANVERIYLNTNDWAESWGLFDTGGDSFYAYVYGGTTDVAWPGQKMTETEANSGIYYLDIYDDDTSVNFLVCVDSTKTVKHRVVNEGNSDITLPADLSVANQFNMWHAWYNDWTYAGNWTLYGESTETVCLIKGTVASLSMDSDTTGQEIGVLSGSEFAITNLLLATTDSFTFTVEQWSLSDGGYSILGDDACKAFFDGTKSALVPLEDGYYNFYVKATEIWVTKSDLIPAADGYYLRGSVLGWEGAPLALEGTGPYTVTREFAANEKIQMIHLESGLATYVPATTVNAADAVYFNAFKAGNDAQVENAGVYTVSITAAGVYTFTDTASAWCQDFLDSMTCTNSGQVAPQFKAGYSWNTTAASYTTTYNALDDFAKDAICGADAVADGTVIQEAVSRYDTIVTNHNYVKFIMDSSSVLRTSYSTQTMRISEGFDAMIIVVIASFTAIAGFGVLMTIKRRKHADK